MTGRRDDDHEGQAAGGRGLAVEVTVATPAIRALIRDDKVYQLYGMLKAGGAYGMQTMEAALAGLVRRGTVRLD